MRFSFFHHDLCHFSPEMLLYLSRNGTVKYSLLYECVDYRYLNKFTSGESAPDSRQSGSLSRKKGEMVVESTFSTGKCTKKAGKWDQRGLAGPFFGADTKKTASTSRFFAVKGGFEPPVPLPVRQFSKLLV